MSSHGGAVRVGKVSIPMSDAVEWVRAYTDSHSKQHGSAPYAFPAYDRYDKACNRPERLTDGDLLAPLLLNVRMPLRAFYGLQTVRDQLEATLARPILGEALGGLDDLTEVLDAVQTLYGVLDREGIHGSKEPPCRRSCTASDPRPWSC